VRCGAKRRQRYQRAGTLSSEKIVLGADLVITWGRQHRAVRYAQVLVRAGVVKDPKHAEKLLHGNRENSVVSEGTDRSGKGQARHPDMHAAEKSDRLVVPEKAANDAKAEERLEGRSRGKENT